jgi:hypothetical protein
MGDAFVRFRSPVEGKILGALLLGEILVETVL